MFQFLIVFSIFISGFSHAAISKKASLSRRPSSILMGEGSIKGGKAGTGFTLLSLQSKVAKSKRAERLSIDMGNGAAQKLEGSVAYFNVQNDPK